MHIDYTCLINRDHPLSADYIPFELIDIGLPFDAAPKDPKRLLEKKAAAAAQNLFHRSQQDGLNLYGISGYRSYSRQKELYDGSPYIAAPGTSEHQSGLALDVSCPSLQMRLDASFAETPEGIWLKKHAPLFGFILRYPPNKEHITNVPYEPWHIRYVTKPLAAYLSMTGMTLEEYHSISEKF